jgi:uncharacterized protein involved in exopolysaccharide biosynthesis
MNHPHLPAAHDDEDDDGMTLGDLVSLLVGQRLLLLGSLVLGGLIGVAAIFLIPPTYTARSLVMPPQQNQGGASQLGSLGALAGLAGGLGVKTAGDQYVALMQSAAVTDALIDRFKLQEVYDEKYRSEAVKQLDKNTRIVLGKKDGLIVIEVDDRNPERAASIANAYVEGLRKLTNTLAVSEAQQRRHFFEQHLATTKQKLIEAQVNLLGSGLSPDSIKAEPRSAAEGYAKLRAEIMAVETRLQMLRQTLTESAPEIAQQKAALASMRAELVRMESAQQKGGPDGADGLGNAGYIAKYREYKYQEMLYDMFAKQYELARVDESKEGALIQVVDAARAPDRKSKPKNSLVMGASIGGALLLAIVVVLVRRPKR